MKRFSTWQICDLWDILSLTAHKQLETISHLGKKVLCSIQSWRKVFKSGEELGQSIICKRFFDGTGLASNSGVSKNHIFFTNKVFSFCPKIAPKRHKLEKPIKIEEKMPKNPCFLTLDSGINVPPWINVVPS